MRTPGGNVTPTNGARLHGACRKPAEVSAWAQAGTLTVMKIRYLHAAAVAAVLTVAGCSSDDRASIATDLQTAAIDVADAAGDVANNATEVLARNIATQQGQDYGCALSPHHTDRNFRPGFRER